MKLLYFVSIMVIFLFFAQKVHSKYYSRYESYNNNRGNYRQRGHYKKYGKYTTILPTTKRPQPPTTTNINQFLFDF